MKRLAHNRTLVTGGQPRGLGQATCAATCWTRGAAVVVADVAAGRTGWKTRARAAEIGAGGRLTTLEMNIGDERSVVDGVRSAVDTLGGLDSLVNAAGILRAAHTEQMGLDLWNQIIGVNLTGTFLVVREALPSLLQNPRSAIVNFSSTLMASFAHSLHGGLRGAAKAGFSPSPTRWRSKYASKGLRAVCVAPGSTQVRNHRCGSRIHSGRRGLGLVHQVDADHADHGGIQRRRDGRSVGRRRRHPRGLVSDDGAFITGTEIRVDGGTTTRDSADVSPTKRHAA